eukprot:gene12922-5951_t
MALKLLLLLNKGFYEPNEAVHATVQIINDSEAGVPAVVRQLSFQASGFERTDPSWISKLYKPEFKAEKSESRRRVRTVFSTERTTLLDSSVVPHRAAQEFHLRLKLPAVLPPSFRGNSVRFSYIIKVKAVYELPDGSGLPAVYETITTSNFLVWPSAAPRTAPSIQNNGRPQSMGGSAIASTSSSQPGAPAGGAAPSPPPPHESQASSGGAPPSSPPAAANPSDDDNTALIEYRLQQTGVRVRFQEVPPEELTMALINSEAVAASPLQFHHTNQLAGTHTPRGNTVHPLLPNSLPEASGRLPVAEAESFIDAAVGIPPALLGHKHSGALTPMEQSVLRLSLQPPLEGPLQPGATFGCLLDFRGLSKSKDSSSPPMCCHQLLVLLETEEVVAAEYRSKGANSVQAGGGVTRKLYCEHQLLVLLETEEVVAAEYRSKGANSVQAGGGVTRKLHCEHQEISTDVSISNFVFTIPASATPSFRTPLVSLRWVLRFELSVGPQLQVPSAGGQRGGQAMQQLVWTLPLLVVAPVMPVR